MLRALGVAVASLQYAKVEEVKDCLGGGRITDFLPSGACVNKVSCDSTLAICNYRHRSHKATCTDTGVQYQLYDEEDCELSAEGQSSPAFSGQQFAPNSCLSTNEGNGMFRKITCSSVGEVVHASSQSEERGIEVENVVHKYVAAAQCLRNYDASFQYSCESSCITVSSYSSPDCSGTKTSHTLECGGNGRFKTFFCKHDGSGKEEKRCSCKSGHAQASSAPWLTSGGIMAGVAMCLLIGSIVGFIGSCALMFTRGFQGRRYINTNTSNKKGSNVRRRHMTLEELERNLGKNRNVAVT